MATVIKADTTIEIEPELRDGLASRPDLSNSSDHETIVRRVMEMYRVCKADQVSVTDVYQPGGEWAEYLAERNGFYEAILSNDFETVSEKLQGFWRNELGPIVKEYAKYEQLIDEQPQFVARFQSCVRRNFSIWKELYNCDASVLEVPNVGNPWGIMIEKQLVVPKAARFHALSTQIIDLTADIERPLVVEVGAGYGGQAYYLLRDRNPITYVDFDLPETLVIAAYYLICTHPDKNILLYGEAETPAGDAWRDYDAILLPNFELPKLANDSVDVFLNTFSFSEVPMATLQEYIAQVERATRKYFLHNNMDRTGVINRGSERIPASQYPIDSTKMKRVYKKLDLFHGHLGDYREYLFEKRS